MGSLPNLSSSSAASGGTVGPANFGPVTIGAAGGGMVTMIVAVLAAGLAVFALLRKNK